MEKMKEETGTYAKRKRKRNLNGLMQYYQNMLTQSLLNALDNFKTEGWTMSINNATPQDWDRLRKQHPPLEVPKRTIDESLMQVYLDMAEEERWVDESLEEIIARQDEEEDVVNNPDHYNTGNVECIEAIEESMTPEAFRGYLKGNCMKYLWRYSYKGKPVEDLQKAQWYLAKLLQEEIFEAEG
jgi:hypothetical protein